MWIEEICVEKIEKVIRKMKDTKAAMVDDTPTELIKGDIEAIYK